MLFWCSKQNVNANSLQGLDIAYSLFKCVDFFVNLGIQFIFYALIHSNFFTNKNNAQSP